MLGFHTTLASVCVVCFFIGVTWMLQSLIKDITGDLCLLKMDEKSDQGGRRLKESFDNIVQLSVEAKQLSKDYLFSDEMEIIVNSSI